MRPRILCLASWFAVLLLAGCAGDLLPGGGGSVPTTTPNQIVYDGALSISIKNGQILAGTNIGYQGKSTDGRALLLIGGEQAPKSTADSVNFVGSPVPGTQLKLNTRVGTFDNSGVNLVGTVHILVLDPQLQSGDLGPDAITAFGIPVQYSVNKGDRVPGTTVQFLGQTPDGAQFSGAGQYPYRQQFDSVVWTGHLRDKVGVRLDLRLLNSSDDSATLVGTAQVRFEK